MVDINSDVTSEKYYSARDLAELGLTRYPTTERGWLRIATKGGWVFREVKSKGRGGIKREYLPPAEIQALIDARRRVIEAASGTTDEMRALEADAIRRASGGEYSGRVGHEPLVTGTGKREGLKLQERQGEQVHVPRYEVKGSSGPGAVVHGERVVEHIAFSPAFVRDVLRVPPAFLAIIEVSGHSMEPTLTSGEQVMVDLRCDRFEDDAVYVIQHNGTLRIKRVQVRLDGTVLIKSDNPSYEPEILKKEEADQLHVVGTVLPYKFGRFKL